MNILIAMDSFKGCITSLEAGFSAAEGIRRVFPGADIRVKGVSDGGEGLLDALLPLAGGVRRRIRVTGPLGEKLEAEYGIIQDGRAAVIETAAAAGLILVPESQRNPLYTTSLGLGELIKDAIEAGCRELIVGLGGSATNDGGAGMLSALGFEFTDDGGHPIPRGAAGLCKLSRISCKNALPELKSCVFTAACDVKNPLCGSSGCSAVFAPQKGASPEDIPLMDAWLGSFAALTERVFPAADRDLPGAGTAGGLGFALSAYLGAKLVPGAEIVLDSILPGDELREADFVITGEGRLDAQTAMGKLPAAVSRRAKLYSKPVLAFCGSAAPEAGELNRQGIDAFFPILRQPVSIKAAMDPETARRNLADTAEQVFRLIKAARGE